MSSGRPRVVVDTNLVVSALIKANSAPDQLLRAWQRDEITVLISGELLAEIGDVLRRDRIRKRLTATDTAVQALLQRFAVAAVRVSAPEGLPMHSRDAKDNMLLAAALGGQADYLVTGDADLLRKSSHRGPAPVSAPSTPWRLIAACLPQCIAIRIVGDRHHSADGPAGSDHDQLHPDALECCARIIREIRIGHDGMDG